MGNVEMVVKNENSILLGYDAASMGNQTATWTSWPMKMRSLHCLGISGSDYMLMHNHILNYTAAKNSKFMVNYIYKSVC